MVVTIDELEAAGLAERRPSKTDRRARVIAVTKAGTRKVEQATEVVERVQTEVLASLPAREREAFLESLSCLVSGCAASSVECSGVRRREPRA
jgi:DNA-binding MarR family transcriptional regulator